MEMRRPIPIRSACLLLIMAPPARTGDVPGCRSHRDCPGRRCKASTSYAQKAMNPPRYGDQLFGHHAVADGCQRPQPGRVDPGSQWGCAQHWWTRRVGGNARPVPGRPTNNVLVVLEQLSGVNAAEALGEAQFPPFRAGRSRDDQILSDRASSPTCWSICPLGGLVFAGAQQPVGLKRAGVAVARARTDQ